MDMKEEMRLRMLIDITSEHVNKRIKKLKGKNKKSLRKEFKEWVVGVEKVKMEKVEFLDWYLYWQVNFHNLILKFLQFLEMADFDKYQTLFGQCIKTFKIVLKEYVILTSKFYYLIKCKN